MKTYELIEILSNMGLKATGESGAIVVRTKDNKLLALVDKDRTYDLRIYEKALIDVGNVDINYLANILWEYTRTPIELRKKENMYLLRNKFLFDCDDFNYLNVRRKDGHATLSTFLQTKSVQTMFTQEEIETMKIKYDTDFKDFEIIEVEE